MKFRIQRHVCLMLRKDKQDYIRKEIETVAGKDVRFRCDKEIPNYSIIRLIKW